MKHAKTMIALVLLFSLLFSGCAMNAPAEEEEVIDRGIDNEYGIEIPGFDPLPYKEPDKSASPTSVKTTMFRAKFEGNAVSGSGEAVDGVYRFNATKTDGEAWHVKLECNYPTVAGRDYRVTYRFTSDVAGRVKFGDFQEFPIQKGDNEVTGVLIATGGTSYLDLQLGMLRPFTIDFKEIEVEEYADDVEFENALDKPVNFKKETLVYERHDSGYVPLFEREEDSVRLYYLSAPWEADVWKSRLYINTGLFPEPGTRYRITADIACDESIEYEALFNDGDKEKGYGALYGQHLTGGETSRLEAVITGNGAGDELVLQLSLGKVPEEASVKVSNLKIDKIKDHYSTVLPGGFALDTSVLTGKTLVNMIPLGFREIPLNISYSSRDTVYEGHDDGYVVSLSEASDSATLTISKAPDNKDDRGVWKAKLYAATGVTLEPGTTYRISYDLKSEKDQAQYEACFDGDSENAYGVLYNRSLTAGGTDHVELILTPDESHGPLTLRLQLGMTDTAAGNTVTLSNLKVEALTLDYKEISVGDLNTGTSGNVSEEHFDGIEQEVSASGDTATLKVSAARTDGGVWSSKLIIHTGVTPEAGAKYRVSLTVGATASLGGYEILYQNGNDGSNYAEQKGLTEPGDYGLAFLAPDSGCGELVLVLQVGDTAADNTITVNNIQVCKVTGGSLEEIELTGFAYPVPGEKTLVENSFALESNSGADAEMTGDGSSATATVNTNGEDWNIKFYAKPGLTLEAGSTYTISFDLSGASGVPVFYKNNGTGDEAGFGTETGNEGTVTHTVTPTTGGEMEIMLKLGLLDEGTAVKVSNVKIEKAETGWSEIDLGEFKYPVSEMIPGETTANSFILEGNSGAAAELTGNGSSATAEITTKGADWNVKFYAVTGLSLEAGKTYKISFDLSGASGVPVCYKNGGNGNEEGYGTEIADAGTVEHQVTPSEGGGLEIMLKIGAFDNGTKITVSNVKVEAAEPAYVNAIAAAIAYPDSFFLEANTGAAAEMSGDGSSATAKVTLPKDDWNVKFYIFPGTVLEAGQTYRISLKVANAPGRQVCFKNSTTGNETGFGDRFLGADATETLTYEVTPSEGGKLEIMLKIGNVPQDTEVTVSDIKVEKLGSEFSEVELNGFAYPVTQMTLGNTTANSFFLESNSGADASLTGDGDSATATVNVNGSDWNIKFYALTGLTLEAGKTYKISFKLSGASGVPVFYKNNTTGNEEGFGSKTADAGTVEHEVTPSDAGGLEIMLKLGAFPVGTEVTMSDIAVYEYADGSVDVTPSGFKYPELEESGADYKSFDLDLGGSADAVLSGDGESKATLTIKAKGDDWHIKLYAKPGVTLESGSSYTISMNVDGADGCTVVYKNKNTDNEEGFGSEQNIASGTVTHVVEPTEDGELEIIVKAGTLEPGTVVTVSDVKVSKATGETAGENLMTDSLSAAEKGTAELWTHEDYAGSVTASGNTATAKITKVPKDGREGWKIKLFLNTGVKLEAGKMYRISADVKSTKDLDYEICYNDGGAEAKLGTLGGQKATSSASTAVYECNAEEAADLLLQFNLGNAGGPCTVTVTNIKVEEMVEGSTENAAADFSYDSVGYFSVAKDDSYETSFWNNENAGIFVINKAPETDRKTWKAKFNVHTGFTPEKGKGYRVTFDIYTVKRQNVFEVFYDGEKEECYGSKFGPALAEGKNTVTKIIYPGESMGPLTIQIRLGETDGTDGNIYAVNNLVIEEVTEFRYERTPEEDAVTTLVTQSGYNESLDKTPDKVTLKILKTPAQGKEPWKSKIFIKTGVKVKEGEKYRVSMMVKSIIPAPFEVCYNDGDEEKGLGAQFGLMSLPTGQYVEYVTYAKKDADLVIQLSLGNCPAPNTLFISDVRVQKAGKVELVSDTVYTF